MNGAGGQRWEKVRILIIKAGRFGESQIGKAKGRNQGTEITVNFGRSWVFFGSSVQFSRSVMSDSLRPHESQHARPPCPSPTPRVHSDSCPSSQ